MKCFILWAVPLFSLDVLLHVFILAVCIMYAHDMQCVDCAYYHPLSYRGTAPAVEQPTTQELYHHETVSLWAVLLCQRSIVAQLQCLQWHYDGIPPWNPFTASNVPRTIRWVSHRDNHALDILNSGHDRFQLNLIFITKSSLVPCVGHTFVYLLETAILNVFCCFCSIAVHFLCPATRSKTWVLFNTENHYLLPSEQGWNSVSLAKLAICKTNSLLLLGRVGGCTKRSITNSKCSWMYMKHSIMTLSL